MQLEKKRWIDALRRRILLKRRKVRLRPALNWPERSPEGGRTSGSSSTWFRSAEIEEMAFTNGGSTVCTTIGNVT